MKTLKYLVLMSLVILLGTTAVLAQEQTGSLFGQVTTVDGAAIVGAKITVSSTALIRPLTTTTNERGSYIYPSLPVGTYTVTFEAEKYQSIKREDISLSIGEQLRVNATLEAGVVGEEVVTITGEAPLIDVKSSDTGMSISKELFNVLPKGRNYTSLVTLAPGAKTEELTGGIEIDGASKAENIWVVNGIDVSDMYGGTTTANAVFEFVEEVQVRSGGYDAEFGGSMGGVVNVITRSGGNEFHGEGSFYLQGDKLDGDPRPSLRLNPLDSTQAEYFTYDKDKYSHYEFGGGLGGYLIKDRVWFFGSYLPVFQDITRDVKWRDSDENIIATEAFEQSQVTHNAAAKVSAQVTDKLRASVSYTTDWYRYKGNLPGLNGHSPRDGQPLTYADQGQKQPGWNIAANIDYLLSDELYFNLKGGMQKTDTKQIGGPVAPFYWHLGRGMFVFQDDPAFASIPARYQVPSGTQTQTYADTYLTKKDKREKMNWSGDLTYFTEMMGSHMLKGGLQFYRIGQDVDQVFAYDHVRFYWDQSTPYNFFTPGINRGTYGYYDIRTAHPSGFGVVADITSDRYAIFAQDSWGITDRLTLNVGVRSEKESIPSFSDLPEYQKSPINFGFGDKVAPRLGAAYDVWGNGKFKLYGNFAMYYDVMKLEMAQGSYGGFKWVSRYFTLDTLEWWTIGGKFQPGPWPRPDMSVFPGIAMGERNWRIPSFDSTDPELKPTAIWEAIIGGDYQLSDNMALNIRFVHKRLIRTIEDVGILTPEGEEYFTTNPGWGYSVTRLAPGAPPTPKALRHYWAMETRLTKRLSNNWQAGANLTLSRLTGNYGGLASADEQGRNSPNVERYFDNWLLSWDANWNPIDGSLPTDRRYVLKLFGSYTFDWGLTVGAYQHIMDGTPHQTDFTMLSLQGLYPLNRGDMGRSDTVYETDLYAEYNFKIGQYRAQANINVMNLWDQDIAYRIYSFYNINNPGPDEQILIDMFNAKTPLDWRSYVTANDIDPRYGMKYHYMTPRSIRLGLKLYF